MKQTRQYIVEGFQITARREGLQIVVTDYHAPPLVLPYEVIESLRRCGSSGDADVAPAPQVPLLLLANDVALRELLLSVLSDYDVTVVRSSADARTCLASKRYALVIVTNFGVSSIDALSTVPAFRDFPALLISGVLDADTKRACAHKGLEFLPVPFEPAALVQIVQRLLEHGQTRPDPDASRARTPSTSLRRNSGADVEF